MLMNSSEHFITNIFLKPSGHPLIKLFPAAQKRIIISEGLEKIGKCVGKMLLVHFIMINTF